MNDLGRHLADRIRLQGPITIADYMGTALGHPTWGYYTSRDPLGRAGDFTTAPEVSQMYGELIGLWCADRWQAMGSPGHFILAELGPGRGTLMADALRAGGALPGFLAAAEIHLVDISPVLRTAQEKALAGRAVTWHDRIVDLPAGPILAIANEFFDALPIHQFQRAADGWHERMVDVRDDEFMTVLNPTATPGAGLAAAELHAVFEVSPARTAAAAELAHHIAGHGGAALIIDYGHGITAPGDTLQAMRAHEYTDPFMAPGEADLTSHVDFQTLADAARGAGARTHGPVSQGHFLDQLGIGARAGRLKTRATAAQTRDIDGALHRLTAQDQMGQLFKVMAVTDMTAPIPPGFEDA
jgi:NADH dehydrogenase [ubiquinone] 1 alpha subcomplex assembly factor 7